MEGARTYFSSEFGRIKKLLVNYVLKGANDYFSKLENYLTHSSLIFLGLVIDVYAENGNDDYKGYKELATQEDFDKF